MKGLVLLAAAAALVACTDTRAPITGTQSIKVELVSPADPGSIDNRLPDTARAVTFKLTAIGPDDQPDTSFHNTLQVYVQYLGTLTPYFGSTPFATVNMTNGTGTLTATLPPVFGPTTVWFDDGADSGATYATGVSPTLWYRDPYIADIQMPASEGAVNALTDSPLENKNVDVRITRYGANGCLLVTSLFSQGYTLADVKCAGPSCAPPCTVQPQPALASAPGGTGGIGYDFIEVFSYSAPLDQLHRFLNEGSVIDGFAGGISNFDGLIEVGFPQTFVTDNTHVCTACEPPAIKIDASGSTSTDWFTNPINFKRAQAALVEIDNVKVCDLDSDFTTFKQWKVDPSGVGGNCLGNRRVINVITSQSTDLDPQTLVGKTLPSIKGILRPIMLPGFDVWIIYPRSMADITTN